MTNRWSAVVVAGSIGLGLCLPAAAHHGASALFDLGRTEEVTGTVKRWSFVNPHPILVLEVADATGATAEWDIYFGPAAAAILRNRGFAPDTFKFGDTLIVNGHPAKVAGARANRRFRQREQRDEAGRYSRSVGNRRLRLHHIFAVQTPSR